LLEDKLVFSRLVLIKLLNVVLDPTRLFKVELAIFKLLLLMLDDTIFDVLKLVFKIFGIVVEVYTFT
jgi:hypothetical protein